MLYLPSMAAQSASPCAPEATSPLATAAHAQALPVTLRRDAGPAFGVALLGAGIIAAGSHYHALSALVSDDVVVRAVWSRTQARAAALAARYGAHVVPYANDDGIDAVLARPDVQAVVLAVPIAQLAALAARCRAAGKHVLSEKPVAHNVQAARAALTAPPSPSFHAVAENFRFEAGVVAAAVDAARINPVCISLTAAMHMPPESHFATSWRLSPQHVGAQLLDGGVHFVAALRMVAKADVVRVCAAVSTASMHLPKPDSASSMLEFANGVHGTMLLTYAAMEFVWEMRVVGTDGDLCLRRVKGTPGYVLETRSAGKCVVKEFPFCGIDYEFKCFVDSCRSGKLDKRLSAVSAFNDLATIEAIVESAERRSSVTVARLVDKSNGN